ncbi:MAG: hypothetical protein KA965_08850 [Butyrivibrio sp.]|nr:hypothetical protein [Butyrivibrio sp.]
MSNFIIIIVMCVIAFFAIKGSTRHLKGEGGCCKGSSDHKENKKLDASEIGRI